MVVNRAWTGQPNSTCGSSRETLFPLPIWKIGEEFIHLKLDMVMAPN